MTYNPYQRYAETNLTVETPEQLVVELYQCVQNAVSAAERCNQGDDHEGRGRSVNQALDVLLELINSLDPAIELSASLRQLYAYMQQRLVEAHFEKSSEKLQEVYNLTTTLLAAWKEVAAARPVAHGCVEEVAPAVLVSSTPVESVFTYGRF